MEWPTEKQLVLDCEDNLYKVYENCWAACATVHTNGPGIEIGTGIYFWIFSPLISDARLLSVIFVAYKWFISGFSLISKNITRCDHSKMFVFDHILPPHVVISNFHLLSVICQRFFAYQLKYHPL